MENRDICIACNNGWNVCCETKNEQIDLKKSDDSNLEARGLCISCYGWTACCGKSDSEVEIKRSELKKSIEDENAVTKKIEEKQIYTWFNGAWHCGDFYTSAACSTGWGCKGYNGEFYCNPSYWDRYCCY